jgi:hypothetical protein
VLRHQRILEGPKFLRRDNLPGDRFRRWSLCPRTGAGNDYDYDYEERGEVGSKDSAHVGWIKQRARPI